MNLAQIEDNLQTLVADIKPETFIYDLLLAYDTPKSTIKRLQAEGGLNLSKKQNEILWKGKLWFKSLGSDELHQDFATIKTNEATLKHKPRFVICTDYNTLLALDTKTSESLDIPIADLAKHFDFFLPWAGMEKAQAKYENPADVKAAERMAKLYDEIKKDNITTTKEEVHNLNVFLSRLLFCFFAEDTGIFDTAQFTNAIKNHTQTDGSDLNTYLDTLFEVMNTSNENRRADLPQYLKSFPYVNGGLFRNKHYAPTFNRKSREAVLASGGLQWKDINPDIFGSMIQAVITPEHRGGMGMHYTSVPNIMKVIEPLFLTELYEVFETALASNSIADKTKKLKELLKRIRNIKVFDPACGSGNFLIIAYKELRKLEMAIFKELDKLQGKLGSGTFDFGESSFSEISLKNFYGIELDDFAHEVATLSLWLAEHQMNQLFFKEFGRTRPALPLMETGNIVHGNATRIDWEVVCPKLAGDEIYILGNPPYLGARVLDESQKNDMSLVFNGNLIGFNDLDYISCWFYKGKEFIQGCNGQCAFVSTNSISQGSQVELIWPSIISDLVEIKFAHLPFKWENNAKSNAGVTCVIIGLRNISTNPKYIFNDKFKTIVQNINAYLIEGKNLYIKTRNRPLSNIPDIKFGSMPNDGGFLILSEDEFHRELENDNRVKQFIRPMFGGQDFIKGTTRYCIWIEDEKVDDALKIPFILNRINQVKLYRLESKREATRRLANLSYKFGEIRHSDSELIIIPATTSERRDIIPMGFLKLGTIINNSAQGIYNAKPWHLSMVLSRIHLIWVRAVSGRLESRIRYSAELSYNTFPFPSITDAQKQELEMHVFRILEEREAHSEKTLAQLYDPDKMPEGLREAHRLNDLAIERCYREKPFESDEERLEYLFKLYEKMIEDEKNKGTLFEATKKTKKKKG
ncbi:hypothetical protein MCERE19_03166 [Spirosomataceae bacterium]